jgi:hypothetical protein
VLATNVALALVLALPFAAALERELAHTGAAHQMVDSFDHDWWTRFEQRSGGSPTSFAPDVLGAGIALRNLDLLARGHVAGGLLAEGADPAMLGVATAYALLQVFLAGGLLGVFRAPRGGWTFRSLVHGSSFYFGRLLRVSLLSVAAAAAVFAADRPLARTVSSMASEAVSERAALALHFGHAALLLLALVVIHMVSSHAKVLVVREERTSAVLAVASSAAFCLRRLVPALGQYGVVLALGALLLAAFAFLDSRLAVRGFATQLPALVLFELAVAGRIALRLGLLASQLELQERAAA